MTERLGWSPSAASRFVQVYELSKHPKLGSFDGLSIDASSLYLIASPSTPEEARQEILDKATTPEGISRADYRGNKSGRISPAARKPLRRSVVRVRRFRPEG